MARFLFLCLLLGTTGWHSGCAPAAFLEAADTSPAHVAALQAAVRADSSNITAVRDLGIVYMHLQRYADAMPLLERARRLDPSDLYTHTYWGLALENTGHLDEALQQYLHYQELARGSRFRSFLAGRYAHVSRALARRDLEARLAAEDSLLGLPVASAISPHTVAVFPMRFLGGDSTYAPLGRGLSTLLMRDLAYVEQLTMLERIHLDVLLDELRLSETEVVQAGTAPRVGRLLRAQHIVGGGYSVTEEKRIRLDVALHEMMQDEQKALPAEDQLDQFFALEKDLVFRLIREIGLVLTPADSAKIETVPTRNLQAFLAYSQGLAAEDAGQYEAATAFFRSAAQLDPGFEEAAELADTHETTSTTSESPGDAIAEVGVPPKDIRNELVRDRHRSLGEQVESLIVPGQDKRDEGPVGGSTDIGRPPDPPPVGN